MAVAALVAGIDARHLDGGADRRGGGVVLVVVEIDLELAEAAGDRVKKWLMEKLTSEWALSTVHEAAVALWPAKASTAKAASAPRTRRVERCIR